MADGKDVQRECQVVAMATTLAGEGSPAIKSITYTGEGIFVPQDVSVTPTAVDIANGTSTATVQWRIPSGLGNSEKKALVFQVSVCGETCERRMLELVHEPDPFRRGGGTGGHSRQVTR